MLNYAVILSCSMSVMNENRQGHSVQAVSVLENGSFVVDEDAVRRVVMRAEARGLPVAVVSVAGATRGGKSFLLDFFLRHLYAPEEARKNGTWLGTDDEPLHGFSWNGGCERDTTGILIWSEPIITTLESGERVAVLLIDTQGTFDTKSTFKESTTIFALSTLISSIQIYNLSQNIKEDDLEHLQFFVQYGKMASSGGEKPFQVLQFLVRDWCYAYQHPIGAVGGQNLLYNRLGEDNCKEELREISQQIKASFESVRCFLMPHPGLKVATNPNFKGCLADIEEEFKTALLELTTLIFHPKNLVLKKINGESIMTEDLLEYLKTYVSAFNSDELPTPVNILKATGEAILEVTSMSARNTYHEAMRLTGEYAVPLRAVPRLHAAAIQQATEQFTTRKMLVTPARQQQRLQELLQELESSLPQYITLNDEKLRVLLTECEAIYERGLQHISCLTPTELVNMHREAVEAAITRFDDALGASGDDDEINEHRVPLLQKFEDNLTELETENASRIRDVLIESKALYDRVLLRNSSENSSDVCMSPTRLDGRRDPAAEDATAYFIAHFTSDDNANNEHKEELLQFIERRWSEISKVNIANNSTAVQQVIRYYNENISQLFAGDRCLHPEYLHSEHERVRLLTIIRFNDTRTDISDEEENDYIIDELNKLVEINYKRHIEMNRLMNANAVVRAHNSYKRMMGFTEGWMATTMALMTPETHLTMLARHSQVKEDTLNEFLTEYRRGDGLTRPVDIHQQILSTLIQNTYISIIYRLLGSMSLMALRLPKVTY